MNGFEKMQVIVRQWNRIEWRNDAGSEDGTAKFARLAIAEGDACQIAKIGQGIGGLVRGGEDNGGIKGAIADLVNQIRTKVRE